MTTTTGLGSFKNTNIRLFLFFAAKPAGIFFFISAVFLLTKFALSGDVELNAGRTTKKLF